MTVEDPAHVDKTDNCLAAAGPSISSSHRRDEQFESARRRHQALTSRGSAFHTRSSVDIARE